MFSNISESAAIFIIQEQMYLDGYLNDRQISSIYNPRIIEIDKDNELVHFDFVVVTGEKSEDVNLQVAVPFDDILYWTRGI